MHLNNYVIVTPCKNEEESLPVVSESIINQTIQPILWIIVNDCSTDNTSNIIDKLTTDYDWIKKVDMDKSTNRDLGLHVAQVYIKGFSFAIDFCNMNKKEYQYIGIVDADMVLTSNYFENLIHEFESDENLGICSGHGYFILNDKIVWPDFRNDFPTGSARLWRKKCFDDTGGYIMTCSQDSVSIAKARMDGWNTKRLRDVTFFSTRADSSAEGLWKGYKQFAFNNYYTGYTFKHIFLKSIKLCFRYPYYVGIPYLFSYIYSYLSRKDRIDDESIINYYKNISDERINELCQKGLRLLKT